eukprot:COSAG05_NODE_6548_length_939_cov_231.538095_1_plen_58_part_01
MDIEQQWTGLEQRLSTTAVYDEEEGGFTGQDAGGKRSSDPPPLIFRAHRRQGKGPGAQ